MNTAQQHSRLNVWPPNQFQSAWWGGSTLLVTKLDRLARSLPDARDLVAEHDARRESEHRGSGA